MVKRTIFLLFALITGITIFAQQKELVKLTLKSGSVHYGEIIVLTDDMVMIQEKDGSRYQFRITDIEKKEVVSGADETTVGSQNETKKTVSNNNSRVYAVAEAGIFNFSTRNAFDNSCAGSVRLSLDKQLLSGNIFAGGGVGIITSIDKNTQLSLLPLFLRCNYILNKSRLSPFAGMEAGYSFSLNKYYTGGIFFAADLGLSFRYSSQNFAKLSITTGIQQIKTGLTETTNSGIFSYYGYTNIFNLGLKAGLQF